MMLSNLSSSSGEEEENGEVIEIASMILDAQAKEIPSILKRLNDILDKLRHDRRQLKVAQRTIWKYDLLNWCVTALTSEYAIIQHDLELFRTIVNILFECCYNVNIEESEEFSSSSLPLAICTSLQLIRNLNQVEKPDKTIRLLQDDLLRHLYKMVAHYPYLSSHILHSNDLLRLIMEHEKHPNLSIKMIKIAQRAVQVDRNCIDVSNKKYVESLMDELVYKLTSSSDELVANSSVHLLVIIARQNKIYEATMKQRYRGLKVILKRWEGQGLDNDLEILKKILEPSSAVATTHYSDDTLKRRKAVAIIWAYYQGWRTRRSMAALRRVVPRVQASWRWKQREQHEQNVENRLEKLQVNMRQKADRQSVRAANEKRMQMLEIVPADQLHSHLQREKESAAVRIQSSWKGYKERQRYEERKDNLRLHHAARIIQKATRHFLKRLWKKREQQEEILQAAISAASNNKTFHDVSGERRKELEVEIMQWQAIHKRFGVHEAEVVETHRKSQEHLTSYYRKRYHEEEEHREADALLTRIHIQQDILQHIPTLDEATRESTNRLACYSTAVQLAAQIEHRKKLKKITQPWWKNLQEDDDGDLIDIEPVS